MYQGIDSPSPSDPGATILIVGAGALGCAAARSLAGSPSLSLTIVDDDRIERSNLQRQTLYREADIGQPKATIAAKRLREDFPDAKVVALNSRLDESNADALIDAHDFVIDGADNPPTKFLINAVGIRTNTAFCYAGVMRTEGQMLSVLPGETACLACLFPAEANQNDDDGGCSRQGILAPVAGVVGAMQAGAATAALGLGQGPGPGQLICYRADGSGWRKVPLDRAPDCPRCGDEAPSATL